MDLDRFKDWIKEPSTWSTIASGFAIFGWQVSEGIISNISAAILAILGIYNIFRREN